MKNFKIFFTKLKDSVIAFCDEAIFLTLTAARIFDELMDGLLAAFFDLPKYFKKFRRFLRKRTDRHEKFLERCQLTVVYFLATVVLMYLTKASLGHFPSGLYKLIPFADSVFESPFLIPFSAPEKTFAMYLLVMEYVIGRPIFRFSLLVKFNIILLVLVELLENLVLIYWNLFTKREMGTSEEFAFWDFEAIDYVFYSFFFLSFLLFYLYCYFRAINGRFPSFPKSNFLERFIDSIAFWLNIKRVKKKKD